LQAANQPVAVVFNMLETGHFQRLRPLIEGLAGRGWAVHVFTHGKFKSQAVQAGSKFYDLFARYPLDLADDESQPVPCRYVSFAAAYGHEIVRDVQRIKPALLIHDTFSVVGRLVAEQLKLPRVNVCAGHNVVPERFLAELRDDPRVRIASQCWEASQSLRDSFGMEDASPFSYVSNLSPDLNLYCEPPEFLTEEERQVFEPVAFLGSLPSSVVGDTQPIRTASTGNPLKVYVSFGTIVWRYYKAEAIAALATLASAVSRMKNVETLISLGGTGFGGAELASLAQPNVRVEDYVDQWQVLAEADLFVTHHGMNSTHEAIFQGAPMLSYPFFWDQPALSAKCQQLGLALPLAKKLRGTLNEDDVRMAVEQWGLERESMRQTLARARTWELAVIARREDILRQVELCAQTGPLPPALRKLSPSRE
jgi:MGT family glycosyltransferase